MTLICARLNGPGKATYCSSPMHSDKRSTLKNRWKEQINIQARSLFLQGRYLMHVAIIALCTFMFLSDVVKTTGIPASVLYLICSNINVYIFLLLIIPLARAMKNRWLVWIGFILNLGLSVAFGFAAFYCLNKVLPGGNLPGFNYGYLFGIVWQYISVYYFFDLFIQQKELNHYRKNLEQKIEAENQFLKTQINPHFLFNTLNNIYSQSIDDPEASVETIQQLRQMLQYMLYDCEQDFVPLSEEIAFIKSYQTLETIRNKSSNTEISFKITGAVEKQKIAPLLLINFIENAFKHGVRSNIDQSFIRINIYIYDKKFTLITENSKPAIAEHNALEKDKGIGIENVKKRLALLYPKRHQLFFKDEADTYTTTLKIRLYK